MRTPPVDLVDVGSSRRLRKIAGGVVAVATAAAAVTWSPAEAAPEKPAWAQSVVGTGESSVAPNAVKTTYGDVSGAEALTTDGSGVAKLTWDGTGVAPTVVLDYGRVVGGYPHFTVDSVSGSTGVRTAYSESLKYLLTAGSTQSVKEVAAGATKLPVSSVANFVVGQNLIIGSGSTQETRTISSIGTAAVTVPSFTALAVGATRAEVPSTAGISVGNELLVGTGSQRETVTVTQVGRASFKTTAVAAVAAGATKVRVAGTGQTCYAGYGCFGTAALRVGDQISVGGDTVTISKIGTPSSAESTLGNTDLDVSAVGSAHDAGSGVVYNGPGLTFTPALSTAHAVDSPLTYPGTGITVSESLTNAHDAGEKVKSAPGAVTGDGAQYAGTGVAAQRYRDTTVAAPGKVVTPNNAFQGGIRFEAITLTKPGTVTLSDVGVTLAHPNYAADDYKGSFESSDQKLTDLWYHGAYTVDTNMVPTGGQNSSTFPVIVDGAKRDRRIWIGDLFTAGRSLYGAFGYGADGSDYLRNSIKVFGDNANANGSVNGDSGNWTSTPAATSPYSTSYSIYYVINLADYFRHSGDAEFTIGQYAAMKKQLQFNASLEDANGLVVTSSGNDGRDWDYYDGGKAGEVTATNVLYYRALTEAAWVGQQLIDSNPDDERASTWKTDVDAWSVKAKAVREAINTRLFDAERGVYVLSDRDNGNHSKNAVAQDANALAVLYGVADKAAEPKILSYLKSNLWGARGPSAFSSDANYSNLISPFITGFETAARFEINDDKGALDLTHTVWDQMIDRDNANYTGAFWENYLPDGTVSDGNTSLAHSWSSAPTWQLSSYVLGAQPVDAGFKTWRVQPRTGDLSWSRGSVPTPRGGLDVSWSKDAKSTAMTVTAPAGTSGEVWVPLAGAEATSRGSEGTELVRRESGYDVFSVAAGGTYTFRSDVVAKPPVVVPGKVSPSVSFKISSSTVKVGRTARARVIVKAKGVRAPVGTLTIKRGSKTLKVVTLRASDKGKRSFVLPKLPRGKYTLKVVYSGGGTVGAKSSVTRTLRVR
jgi:alpha-L-rhamnosidase